MSRNYTGLGRYEQLFDQLDAAMSRLESRWEAIDRRVTKLQASKAAHRCYSSNYDTAPYQQPTHFRPCHAQPPGWPPPQRSPPSCWPAQRRRHAYGKQQQHQPVPARIEPLNCRFGDSRPVFEQLSYTFTVSDAALQNSDAEYHVGQSDYPPPHSPYRDSYGQPHNSSAKYHLKQPEPPLPDRTLHPPTPRPRSYQRPAPTCTVSENSSAATTQSRSCHEQPPVVLQPLLSPTNLQRSAISPMASTAAPLPQLPPPPSYRCPPFVTDKSSATRQTDVYRTRRSARFIERGAKLLQGVSSCLEKDFYTNEVLDFKMNSEESWDRSVEVAGVTDVEEPENKVEGQVYNLNQTPNTFSSLDPYLLSFTILSTEEMHADIRFNVIALNSAPSRDPTLTMTDDHILPYTFSLKARGGFFVNMSFARMRGVECRNSSEIVDQNGLLRAQCLIFMRLNDLVKHSLPIGGILREYHPDEKELLLVQNFFKDMDGEVHRLLLERDKDAIWQVPLEDLDIAMMNRHLSRRYAKETLKRTRSRLFSKSSAWNDFLPVIAFDPGGKISKLYYHRLCSLFRGSHLEDKVDFNRGGVVTIPYLAYPN